MTLRGRAERTAIGMLLLELMGVMEENGAPVSKLILELLDQAE